MILMAALFLHLALKAQPSLSFSNAPNVITMNGTFYWSGWMGEIRIYVGTNYGNWLTNFTSNGGTNLAFSLKWRSDCYFIAVARAVNEALLESDDSDEAVFWMPPPASNVVVYGLVPGAPIQTGNVNGAWSRMGTATGSQIIFPIRSSLLIRSTNTLKIQLQ